MGRWQAARTARLYLNEGLATAEMHFTQFKVRLSPFHLTFKRSNPTTYQTLEPPKGRAGGRGRKGRSGRKAKKSGPKKRNRSKRRTQEPCSPRWLGSGQPLGGYPFISKKDPWGLWAQCKDCTRGGISLSCPEWTYCCLFHWLHCCEAEQKGVLLFASPTPGVKSKMFLTCSSGFGSSTLPSPFNFPLNQIVGRVDQEERPRNLVLKSATGQRDEHRNPVV